MNIRFHSKEVQIFIDNLMVGTCKEIKDKKTGTVKTIVMLAKPYSLKYFEADKENPLSLRYNKYIFGGPEIPFGTIQHGIEKEENHNEEN